MSDAIEVTYQNFQTEVLQKSMEQYVVLDFWAPWCAPCRALGPVLEKLSKEYGFVLAKLDTEANPELAMQFRIQSIPHVKVVFKGREVTNFNGALPEAQLRQVFDKYIKPVVDEQLEPVLDLLSQGQIEDALAVFAEVQQEKPDIKVMPIVKELLAGNFYSHARVLCEKVSSSHTDYKEAQNTIELLKLVEETTQHTVNDPTNIFFKAAQFLLNKEYKEAMELYLEEFKKGGEDKDKSRQCLITVFKFLGSGNPLTLEYRSKLSTLLFV